MHRSNYSLSLIMAERIFASLSAKKEFEIRKAQEICSWVIAQLNEKIELSHLLEASGLSQFQLVRIFEIHLKTTPIQWVRQQKELQSQGKPTFEFAVDMQSEKTHALFIPERLRKK